MKIELWGPALINVQGDSKIEISNVERIAINGKHLVYGYPDSGIHLTDAQTNQFTIIENIKEKEFND